MHYGIKISTSGRLIGYVNYLVHSDFAVPSPFESAIIINRCVNDFICGPSI